MNGKLGYLHILKASTTDYATNTTFMGFMFLNITRLWNNVQ